MQKFLKKVRRSFRRLVEGIQEWRKRERSLSYGTEYPDKTFYVIGCDYDTQGLFAIVKSVLCHIMYATDKGWIPVVDMLHFSSQYSQTNVNVWEKYFEQPCGYSLEDIKKGKNIVRANQQMYPNDRYVIYVDVLDDKQRCEEVSDAYKKYIRPQNVIEERVEKLEKELGIGERTLGVLCRGTDYLNRAPHNHPRQPQPADVITDARKFIEQYNYDSVFVATEDADVLEMFKREFGDKLKYINQTRMHLSKKQNYLSEITDDNGVLNEVAVDYYSALNILSRCTAIIAGRTAGTLGAVFMSDGFQYSHFYDLGYYE